jgi:cytochrome c biogenesis protein
MAVKRRAAPVSVRMFPRGLARHWSGTLDAAWRTLSSVKVALFLILALTVLTLVGTLVSQAPVQAQPGTPQYTDWLAQAEGRFGPWTGLMDRLQLFSVFDSLLFKGVGALLILNILVCALDRWRGTWTSIARNRVRMPDGFYKYAPRQMTAARPPAEVAVTLSRVLKRERYRPVSVEEGGCFYVFCNKNRLARLGTYLTHLGIILLVAGYVTGQIAGWSDDQFIITEGETRRVGFGTALSVTLEQFADEWWLAGPPKDFRSDIVLSQGDREVRRGTVRVNHPLSYDGVRLFQSFYGTSAMMQVRGQTGELLFDQGVPLAWRYRERSVGSFAIPEEGLKVWVVLPQSGVADTWVKAGEVRIEVVEDGRTAPIAVANLTQEQSQEVAGLTYLFARERPFSGLRVAQDPALNVVWAAFILLSVGMIAVFYFPHRRLWISVRPAADGGSALALRGVVGRDADFERELDRLADRLRSRLRAQAQGG